MSKNVERIIIKIGSNVLTRADGLPDQERIAHLVDQMAAIRQQGKEIILVSSGAVASGRSIIRVDEKVNAVATRQLLASIGQVKLINTYAGLFEQHNLLCAQVLVTKEDFRDRMHYLNMKSCLEILLQQGAVPVVNENDVVSVTELMFTDNDELAGLIASMMNAQRLIILSNVNGIYDGHPGTPGSKVIEKVDSTSASLVGFIGSGHSAFGRGGMLTKYKMAQKMAQLGIGVHIANGTVENILVNVLGGKALHTCFVPDKNTSGKKKWIAHSESQAKATVTINNGAKAMLASKKAISLLPVGVIAVEAGFQKGDIIKLIDEQGEQVGLGIAEYGADKARERMGKKNQRPLVHYDYLYLNG